MKKIVVLLTALAMIFTCTACEGDKMTTGSKVEIADANEILAKTWAEYKASVSEDMVFPVGGGNAESMVMDEPAKFDTAVETAQDTLLALFVLMQNWWQ